MSSMSDRKAAIAAMFARMGGAPPPKAVIESQKESGIEQPKPKAPPKPKEPEKPTYTFPEPPCPPVDYPVSKMNKFTNSN